MELFFILLCHICHLQSSCCLPCFNFILYIIQSPVSSVNVSLLSVSTLKSTVRCPYSAIPHLPHNHPGCKVPISNTLLPKIIHTHTPAVPSCCVSTHSPFENEYHFNWIFVALGCIFLFPLMEVFTFLFVNCCVRNTPTVDCCIYARLTSLHLPPHLSYLPIPPFHCCVLHWKRDNFLVTVTVNHQYNSVTMRRSLLCYTILYDNLINIKVYVQQCIDNDLQ